MRKRIVCLALGMVAVLFTANSSIGGVTTDPTYSYVDGVYFSDPSVNCDNLKNSEVCEMFKAAEIYSLRDGLSYSDCAIECIDMIESDACFSFRETYPCPGESDGLVASLDALESDNQITN